MSADGCTEACWTPKPCPEHGNPMTPRGRSAPIGMYQCCDNYAQPRLNPRHLWSIHDDTRWYVDPRGWDAHVAQCEPCRGDLS